MALGASRIVQVGETPHAHEREGIDLAIQSLPNNDPYHLWALVDLIEPSTGRMYEIDLLVIGYSALYLVELKGGPGRYEGDSTDWWRAVDGEPPRWMEPPLRLTNHKAKVLKSRLATRLGDRAPWVEALVFLSHKEAQVALKPEGRVRVVTRETFARAITHHEFPGSPPDWRPRPINHPLAHDIAQAFAAIGIRPRKGKAFVGNYELREVLQDGPGYQDRVAVHRDNPRMVRRARTYLVPQQTSVERRQQLRRAAEREAQLLYDVREHASILTCTDYVADAPLGPTVLLDPFEAGQPLSAFLRQSPKLPFTERVEIVQQIGRALAFCHRKGVTHGALSPEAVLVRRHPDTTVLETRLLNFQLAASGELEPTSHTTALLTEPWAVYQAPELREDPVRRSPVSDMFSLGALAYYVFTGRPPADSAALLDERLRRDRGLDPRAADDGIPEKVAELVDLGTKLSTIERADSVEGWVELLIDETTQPERSDTPAIQPLQAREHDVLEGGLLVRGLLGQGATSRVLLVERDGRSLALKVSLGPDHDSRLDDEARVLRGLRHPRVVQLVDVLNLEGRTCLLLSLAGETSVHGLLVREGSLSLDFAARWGEDLLSALEYLEEEARLVHRDIKPANLGVGAAGKDARRLTLLDFSLSALPATDLGVGTSAYRDPFLSQRGAWDFAADRWSAAITLHEMLTGVRPGFGDRLGSALDHQATLVLAAERFDATVRGGLTAFFAHALERESERRFASAKEMRHAWLAACSARLPLAAQGATKATTDAAAKETINRTTSEKVEVREAVPAELTEAQYAAIPPEAPLEALPLSPRARNALDRAGLTCARDLLALADNRLSAIRGIGTAVARDILEFRKAWQRAQALTPGESKPFFPSYRGEDLSLPTTGLPDPVTAALQDAGLFGLRTVAETPAAQVAALVNRAGASVEALQTVLAAENRRTDERDHPSTLEGWVDSLLAAHKPAAKYLKALFGLEAPLEGRLDVTAREAAEATKKTPANIYIQLGKAREAWRKHPAWPDLTRLGHLVIDAAGGAAPLERAADELRALLPHDRTTTDLLLRARAATLLRAVAEVEKEDPAGLQYVRLRDQAPWLFASEAHAEAVRRLGDAADELAARPVLVSPGEAARVLAEVVATLPIGALPADRVVALAASASQQAALSARLEIYPRDMDPARALDLCAGVLGNDMTEDEVRQRVRSRYPAAPELPPRPELDQLLRELKPHGLAWNDTDQKYIRPGTAPGASLHTRVFSSERLKTALPAQSRLMSEDALAARDFDDQVRAALEGRAFKVLGVTADRARRAALSLSSALGMRRVALDTVLIEEARKLAGEQDLPPGLLDEVDQQGPAAVEWEDLRNLMVAAGKRVAERLLPPREPLLLVHPGLIERYRLTGLLQALVATRSAPDAAALFLLIPGHDIGGVPRINGRLSIPEVLPGQALWVSREWLDNKHQAAA